MNKIVFLATALFVAMVGLDGCNAGMEPEGPTPDQIRAKIDSMPPDQQIEMIQNSPMTKDEKAQRIKGIQDKFHLSADAASANPGVPVQGIPPADGSR